MGSLSRRAVVMSLGVAAAGGTVGWRWLATTAPTAPAAVSETTTVAVVRADLVSREQVAGTLGYAGDWQIHHLGPPGVVTAAALPAAVVSRGERLYEVDGRPARLLYGERPAWRELAPGVTAGPDVTQLQENLAALGFPVGRPNSGSAGRFTTAISSAIRAWQRRLGEPVTGRLALGSVVFAPEPVRVAEVLAPLGSRLGGGPVLRVTSIRPVVTAQLPAARQGAVSAGGAVEVTIPGGEPLPATVIAVSRVALPVRPDAPATLTVTAGLDRPQAGGLDQVPVLVTITTAQRRGVLAVPLTALRAASAGGYEILVVDGATRKPVAVRPGLLDERAGLIEILLGTDQAIAAGTMVEVPRP